MKILGVGLSRTGTLSLHAAVKALGFSSIHYDTIRLNDVIDGSNAKPDFRRYDDVDAVMDLPAAYFFDELIAAYPECKCVLTVRDLDGWWRSVSAHFNQKYPAAPAESGFARRLKKYGRALPRSGEKKGPRDYNLFRIQLRNLVYGCTTAQEYIYKKKYEEHRARVMRTIPANRLLVMNIPAGDGWNKLCPFLGVATPSGPFPHEHRTGE